MGTMVKCLLLALPAAPVSEAEATVFLHSLPPSFRHHFDRGCEIHSMGPMLLEQAGSLARRLGRHEEALRLAKTALLFHFNPAQQYHARLGIGTGVILNWSAPAASNAR